MNIKCQAFTLIELILVLAIFSGFMTLAFPSYQHWILKIKKQSVMAWLIEAEMNLENCYLNHQSYLNCDHTLPLLIPEIKSFFLDPQKTAYTLQVTAVDQPDCEIWWTDQTHTWKVYHHSGKEVSRECLR